MPASRGIPAGNHPGTPLTVPMGARCIEHTRWHGDTSGATATYVSKQCPTRWASVQPTYDCGGAKSTLHTAKGFAIPPLVRSLIGNESALPTD